MTYRLMMKKNRFSLLRRETPRALLWMTTWLVSMSLMLSGCSVLSGVGKDNTPPPSPLVQFSPQQKMNTVWRTQVGSGADKGHLHFDTCLYQGVIYTVDSSGRVVATHAQQGRTLWAANTKFHPSAGPCVRGNILTFSTHQGEVVALDRYNGRCLWQTCVGCPLLVTPVIADRFVLAKSVDGTLTALDLATGQICWHFKHAAQTVTLHADSAPLVAKGIVFVGFSDGQFFALRLSTGTLLWQQMVALPRGVSDLDTMIGVIADPVVVNSWVYVLTYQGKLSALSAQTGQVLWQHDLSSYENLSWCGPLIAVTDDEGKIWGINRFNGRVLWCQDALLHRTPTAPLVTNQGVWIGDCEGYLHLLSSKNGCFLARCLINGSGLFVQPITDGTGVIVRSEGGELLKVI
jgi:outer membrane protein assembly factor BamB